MEPPPSSSASITPETLSFGPSSLNGEKGGPSGSFGGAKWNDETAS